MQTPMGWVGETLQNTEQTLEFDVAKTRKKQCKPPLVVHGKILKNVQQKQGKSNANPYGLCGKSRQNTQQTPVVHIGKTMKKQCKPLWLI